MRPSSIAILKIIWRELGKNILQIYSLFIIIIWFFIKELIHTDNPDETSKWMAFVLSLVAALIIFIGIINISTKYFGKKKSLYPYKLYTYPIENNVLLSLFYFSGVAGSIITAFLLLWSTNKIYHFDNSISQAMYICIVYTFIFPLSWNRVFRNCVVGFYVFCFVLLPLAAVMGTVFNISIPEFVSYLLGKVFYPIGVVFKCIGNHLKISTILLIPINYFITLAGIRMERAKSTHFAKFRKGITVKQVWGYIGNLRLPFRHIENKPQKAQCWAFFYEDWNILESLLFLTVPLLLLIPQMGGFFVFIVILFIVIRTKVRQKNLEKQITTPYYFHLPITNYNLGKTLFYSVYLHKLLNTFILLFSYALAWMLFFKWIPLYPIKEFSLKESIEPFIWLIIIYWAYQGYRFLFGYKINEMTKYVKWIFFACIFLFFAYIPIYANVLMVINPEYFLWGIALTVLLQLFNLTIFGWLDFKDNERYYFMMLCILIVTFFISAIIFYGDYRNIQQYIPWPILLILIAFILSPLVSAPLMIRLQRHR